MKASVPTLLRRTAAIVVATGSFCLIGEAAAAPPISFPGGSCTLSRITITPAGGLAIECETAAGVTPSITLTSPSTMTVNTLASFSINRSGDNGPTNVGWSGTGTATGCNGQGGILTFTAGGSNSLPFSLTPSSTGTCTVALNMTASSAGALGSPNQATFNVSSTAAPPPPPPPSGGPAAGCPAAPLDLIEGSLVYQGGPRVVMPSGRVFSAPLPNLGALTSGVVRLAEASVSPQAMQSLQMTISRCKGEILTTRTACSITSPQGSLNDIPWVQASVPYFSDADGQAMGLCYAKVSEGQWYLNLRYNYTECAHGQCGYVLQWNNGPL